MSFKWLAVPCAIVCAFAGETDVNKGIAKIGVGRYAEAYEVLQPAWQSAKARLGGTHVETLCLQTYVGQILTMLGRPREALDLLGPSLRGLEEVLGVNAPKTLVAKATLAIALRESGNPAEAARVLGQLINNPSFPRAGLPGTYGQYALALAYLGKEKDAVKNARQAVKLSTEAGMERTLDHIHLLVSLGQIELVAGKTDAAGQTLRSAESMAAFVMEDNHPERATMYSGLGIVSFRHGRLRESEQYLRNALRIAELVLGPEHPEVSTVLRYLAVVTQSNGNKHEATELAARSATIERRAQQQPVSVWSLRSEK